MSFVTFSKYCNFIQLHFENKVLYIYETDPKLVEYCNFFLKIILLVSLAIDKVKILFCNIVENTQY